MISSAMVLALALAQTPARAQSGPPPVRPSDQSYYLSMRDGVRVAVNLYFPDHHAPAARAPVVLMQTRYGRAGTVYDVTNAGPTFWLDAGYVLAVVDTRGSTSSFGPRDVDIGPAEVRDMDEIIAHLASRPWAEGKVIAYGFSYLADTADWATSRPAPALVGSVPREVDFDIYRDLFNPGGVSNDWFLMAWGGATLNMDMGRSDDGKFDCLARESDCSHLFPVLQAVDGDASHDLLRQALAGKKRWAPSDYVAAEFRDDRGKGDEPPLFSSSSSSVLGDIRRERKPTYYGASWMDAGTAQGALARFSSAPEVPMELWITPDNHSHRVGADPLRPDDRSPRPSVEQQQADILDFAQRVRDGRPIGRVIHYYVMGADRFDVTPVWPPKGVRIRTFDFMPGHRLGPKPPTPSVDTYNVDFTATTGDHTRWSTQFGAPPAYTDRREEDRKLLVYDGAPLKSDKEVVGAPVVTLRLATATADPAVFVYLEDVAPDGRVTYLTEGEFRAINRKPADPSSLPYDQGPAPHSFRRADAQPMVPGKMAEIRFSLLPTAALVRKGHRLRVAIAGTDAKIFHRYSQGLPDVFTLGLGGATASAIDIPLRTAGVVRRP